MGNDASGNTISLEPDTNQVTAAHLMILLLVTYVCPNLWKSRQCSYGCHFDVSGRLIVVIFFAVQIHSPTKFVNLKC